MLHHPDQSFFYDIESWLLLSLLESDWYAGPRHQISGHTLDSLKNVTCFKISRRLGEKDVFLGGPCMLCPLQPSCDFEKTNFFHSYALQTWKSQSINLKKREVI